MENTNVIENPANVTEQPTEIIADQPTEIIDEQPAEIIDEQPVDNDTDPEQVPIAPEQGTEQPAQLSPPSASYVEALVQPYRDALAAATNVDAILQWIPAVVPERAADIVQIVSGIVDVEAAKDFTIETLKNLLVGYVSITVDAPFNEITPWDIASTRDDMLTRLFGGPLNQLPVTVVVGDKAYVHQLTEELTYGLAVGLEEVQGFGLFLNNTQITPDLFAGKYTEVDGKYSATIEGKDYQFMTPDFIQGVKTAAQWRNINPKVMITKLSEYQDDTEVPLNY